MDANYLVKYRINSALLEEERGKCSEMCGDQLRQSGQGQGMVDSPALGRGGRQSDPGLCLFSDCGAQFTCPPQC